MSGSVKEVSQASDKIVVDRTNYRELQEEIKKLAEEKLVLQNQLMDMKQFRHAYYDIKKSSSYKLGRTMLFPLRRLKLLYETMRHNLGLLKNRHRLKLKIDETYSIKRTNTRSKLRVDTYIRSYYHPTSSTFIRLVSPFAHEMLQNISVMNLRDGEKLQFYKDVDVIVVQRTAIAHMEDATKLVNHVQDNKIKLFVDTDDAFGELDVNHPQYEVQKERVDALNYIIKHADEVWFSTDQLQKLYSPIKSKVINNTLDEKIWPKLKTRMVVPPNATEPLRAVYMGTVTHNEDFEMIIPALDRLHADRPGQFKLYVIGVSARLSEKPWVEKMKPDSSLYPDFVSWFSKLPQFDIGLSPLVDNAFNKSKSDIKCLDYLACGIRPVVSDVEAYENPELDNLIVRVKNTEDEWFRALENEIINLDRSRKSMQIHAEKGFTYIENVRSTEVAAKTIKESLGINKA